MFFLELKKDCISGVPNVIINVPVAWIGYAETVSLSIWECLNVKVIKKNRINSYLITISFETWPRAA